MMFLLQLPSDHADRRREPQIIQAHDNGNRKIGTGKLAQDIKTISFHFADIFIFIYWPFLRWAVLLEEYSDFVPLDNARKLHDSAMRCL